MTKIFPPPKTEVPLEARVTTAVKDFDRALAAVHHPKVQIRIPDYDAWLGSLYDRYKSCVVRDKGARLFSFYSTSSQRRDVEDDYPEGLKPWKEHAQATDVKYPPPPSEHWPLENEIERILKDAQLNGRNGGEKFFIGNGRKGGHAYAKIYGCLRTQKADRFAKKIVDWSRNGAPPVQGKFYELMIFESHNKLCMYLPFESLPKVAGFLADEQEHFHQIEFNHPAGAHLFSGVSVAIASEKGISFDESVALVLRNAANECINERDLISDPLVHLIREKHGTGTKRAFVEASKHLLETRPDTAYHFGWLKSRQENHFPVYLPPA